MRFVGNLAINREESKHSNMEVNVIFLPKYSYDQIFPVAEAETGAQFKVTATKPWVTIGLSKKFLWVFPKTLVGKTQTNILANPIH